MSHFSVGLEENRSRTALKFWTNDKEVFEKVSDYIQMVIDANRYENWLKASHIDQDGWKRVFEEEEE